MSLHGVCVLEAPTIGSCIAVVEAPASRSATATTLHHQRVTIVVVVAVVSAGLPRLLAIKLLWLVVVTIRWAIVIVMLATIVVVWEEIVNLGCRLLLLLALLIA